MLRIEISDGDGFIQEVIEAVVGVEDQLPFREALDAGAAALLNRQRVRFLNRESPDGIPWIPSRAGIAREARGLPGTLFDTGLLFHSIQVSGSGDEERFIGTDVPYGEKHQLGLDGMLKREFLGFNQEDELIFTQIVQNELARGISGG